LRVSSPAGWRHCLCRPGGAGGGHDCAETDAACPRPWRIAAAGAHHDRHPPHQDFGRAPASTGGTQPDTTSRRFWDDDSALYHCRWHVWQQQTERAGGFSRHRGRCPGMTKRRPPRSRTAAVVRWRNGIQVMGRTPARTVPVPSPTSPWPGLRRRRLRRHRPSGGRRPGAGFRYRTSAGGQVPRESQKRRTVGVRRP
jgi:hypothetical protein